MCPHRYLRQPESTTTSIVSARPPGRTSTPLRRWSSWTTASRIRRSFLFPTPIRFAIGCYSWEHGRILRSHPHGDASDTNPLDDYFDQIANSWKVRINIDSVITPSLLNHVTLSADRYINLGPNGTDGQGWDQKLGITGIPADNGSFPAISFSGGNQSPTGFGRAYEENWHEMRYTLDENLSWTQGKHAFKFGAEIGRNQEIRFIKPGVAGSFAFNSLSTSSKCK